jgi:hypothetical protein
MEYSFFMFGLNRDVDVLWRGQVHRRSFDVVAILNTPGCRRTDLNLVTDGKWACLWRAEMLKIFHGNRVWKVNGRRNMLLIIVSVPFNIPGMQLPPAGEVSNFVTRDASTIFRRLCTLASHRSQVVILVNLL